MFVTNNKNINEDQNEKIVKKWEKKLNPQLQKIYIKTMKALERIYKTGRMKNKTKKSEKKTTKKK